MSRQSGFPTFQEIISQPMSFSQSIPSFQQIQTEMTEGRKRTMPSFEEIISKKAKKVVTYEIKTRWMVTDFIGQIFNDDGTSSYENFPPPSRGDIVFRINSRFFLDMPGTDENILFSLFTMNVFTKKICESLMKEKKMPDAIALCKRIHSGEVSPFGYDRRTGKRVPDWNTTCRYIFICPEICSQVFEYLSVIISSNQYEQVINDQSIGYNGYTNGGQRSRTPFNLVETFAVDYGSVPTRPFINTQYSEYNDDVVDTRLCTGDHCMLYWEGGLDTAYILKKGYAYDEKMFKVVHAQVYPSKIPFFTFNTIKQKYLPDSRPGKCLGVVGILPHHKSSFSYNEGTLSLKDHWKYLQNSERIPLNLMPCK